MHEISKEIPVIGFIVSRYYLKSIKISNIYDVIFLKVNPINNNNKKNF